jgi:hypothetical protein
MTRAPRRIRRLVAAFVAVGLFTPVAACGSEPSQPSDPADVNVESDDILPPGTQAPAGTSDAPVIYDDGPMDDDGPMYDDGPMDDDGPMYDDGPMDDDGPMYDDGPMDDDGPMGGSDSSGGRDY